MERLKLNLCHHIPSGNQDDINLHRHIRDIDIQQSKMWNRGLTVEKSFIQAPNSIQDFIP